MTTTISQLHSLHPHIITTIPNVEPPNDLACALDVIYRLPPSVFVDRYQLNDTLDSFFVKGGEDLEAPLEHVDPQGTWLIIRGSHTIDLPVHLRYQTADPFVSHRPISLPGPVPGWSCQATHLLPPSLPSALYHHMNNKNDDNSNNNNNNNSPLTWIPLAPTRTLELTVPVGNTKDAGIIQWGTLVVIILGTTWILYAIGYAVQKHRRHLAKGKRRKSE